jgi:hypothetical protein
MVPQRNVVCPLAARSKARFVCFVSEVWTLLQWHGSRKTDMHREGTTTATFIDPPSMAQKYVPKATMAIPEGSRILTGAHRTPLCSSLPPYKHREQPCRRVGAQTGTERFNGLITRQYGEATDAIGVRTADGVHASCLVLPA